MNKPPAKVGLFVSCLIDITRPQIGFAAIKLLETIGCQVSVPNQSCCAQPAYNNGNKKEAKEIAKATLDAFQDFDYVITPTGSCAGMLKYHYTELFQDDDIWQEKAKSLKARTHELISFLYAKSDTPITKAIYEGRIYYHESCSSRREMKTEGALELLQSVKGAEILELPENEACCGFGGLFSVKYDEISNAMVNKKVNSLPQEKNALLTGLDLGCLMNISGKLASNGHPIRVRHIAEVLCGDFSGADI